jgi:thiol-disulfide isomerase/thioredoxin
MCPRLLISVAVVFLSLSVGSSNGQQGPGAPLTSIKQEPLSDLPKSLLDAELKAARGNSFRLSDYSGKVLMVNLWATWCGPCRLETPALVKLHKQFRSQGVEMVGLSTENPDISAREVRKWVRRFGVYYKIGWATPEVALTLIQGRDLLPQSFVISRSGRIVRRFIGFNYKATPAQWKLAIQEALNDKGGLTEQN